MLKLMHQWYNYVRENYNNQDLSVSGAKENLTSYIFYCYVWKKSGLRATMLCLSTKIVFTINCFYH